MLRLSEEEARRQFPNLTVASLGAYRKEKLGGVIAARVLFDGTPASLLTAGKRTDRSGHRETDARKVDDE